MVWRCERCGEEYETDDPPCEACGHEWFEEVSERVDSTGEAVWVCTECGRAHVKNSPPCSRCGNHDFERRRQSFEEGAAVAPSYLDLASPRYLLAAIVLVALLGLFALAVLGVVPLPEALGGQPRVSDVPGNATAAAGVDLASVETATLAAVNDRRADAGNDDLARSDSLDEMARYFNGKRVKAAYGDGDPPQARGLARRFDYPCSRSLVGGVTPTDEGSVTTLDDATAADALGQRLAASLATGEVVTDGERETIGIDVHAAPDGTLYATAFAC